MKCCLRCESTKDELDFHRSTKTKDGFSRWCKDCWVSYQKLKRSRILICPHCSKSFNPSLGQKFCSFDCSLWGRIDKKDDNLCWEWLGTKKEGGYGLISIGGSQQRVTRVILQELGFSIEGLDVCHHCDNPSCCNPRHLFLGTAKDNVLDMHLKGRDNHPKGDNHGKSKITEYQAREVKILLSSMRHKDISKKLGVSINIVDQISAGATWKWL